MKSANAERFWTLPNVVSLSRLGLGVAFVIIGDSEWRMALVGVATTTDYLDGWLARRRGAFSRWGALVDPLSDRAFILAAVAALAYEGALTPFAVCVFMSRDVATGVAFLVARRVEALRRVTFVARFPGKVVTVLQLLALMVAVVAPARIGAPLAVLGAASVIAIGDYAVALWSARTR